MTTTGSESTTETNPPAEIVARPGSYYRNTRYFITALILFMGIWFMKDGFVTWPKENAKAQAEGKVVLPHPGFDVPLQRILGVLLPPLSIVLLVRWLYISRGEYRLAGQTLYVPGHPPVPFDMITTVDKRQWDRKGIAYVEYEAQGRHGRLKLDDFVYDRTPTDQIYDEILKFVAPSESAAAPATSEAQAKSPEV